MPTHIQDRINELIVKKILQEGDKSPTAQRMQDLAGPAILAGQRDAAGTITTQWKAFMVFLLTRDGAAAADPADLARLIPETDDSDIARQKERAYLVGNGMCGTATGGNIILNGNLTTELDKP